LKNGFLSKVILEMRKEEVDESSARRGKTND